MKSRRKIRMDWTLRAQCAVRRGNWISRDSSRDFQHVFVCLWVLRNSFQNTTQVHYVVVVILTLKLSYIYFVIVNILKTFGSKFFFFVDTFYKIIRIDEAMIIILDCNIIDDAYSWEISYKYS